MAGPIEIPTLAGTIDELARRGFTEHFVLANDRLCAAYSGRVFLPENVIVSEYHRFEGVSDPDDLAILYAIQTHTGLRGTLADAFGVYADPAVSAFMRSVVAKHLAQPASSTAAER
jgi:hypothetical protein